VTQEAAGIFKRERLDVDDLRGKARGVDRTLALFDSELR